MVFILVRDPRQGRILDQMILDETDAEHPWDDPFWNQVTQATRTLKATYPHAEVIKGVSESVEVFLSNHPEYQEIIS